MTSEKKICARCGKEINEYEAKLKDGEPYHQDCIDSMELDEHLDFLEQRFPTTDRKLARIIRQNIQIETNTKNAANALNTIKNIIIVLILLAVIGAIFQACSVLG